jgi:hypothetical protein
VTAATLTFTAPTTPGTYIFRFFANNTFTKLATSGTVTVQAPTPTIVALPATVNPGAPITVTVANGPGNPMDWVTLADSTAPDTVYTNWKFLNGSTAPPATGVTAATLTFTAPTTPGTYIFRFFANNTFTKLATSGTVTVQALPALSINDLTVTEGDSGTTRATFTVALTPAGSQTVAVTY